MASPHIGSESRETVQQQEIVFIETDKLTLSIKGVVAHPRIGLLRIAENVSQINIACPDDYALSILGESNIGSACIPLFFENQDYVIVIESKTDAAPTFWHENQQLRNRVTPIGRSNKYLSGLVNFGNDIGFSDLIIRLDGRNYLVLRIEVYPGKIDYQKDYIQLMQDITDEIYNLAFEFLRKTYASAQASNKVSNSDTEYFSIIRLIFEKYILAVDILIAKPHHAMESISSIVQVHKISRNSQQTIKWMQKHVDQYKLSTNDHLLSIQQTNAHVVSGKALTVKKHITFDTFENRLVKFILHSTRKRLFRLKEHYQALDRKSDHAVIQQISDMVHHIDRRLNFSFLATVSDLSGIHSNSMVIARAPGYSELYRYYQMLLRGLNLDSGLFRISVKDLASVYEYWCFIKLGQILKKHYRLIKQDIIKTNQYGLFVTLQKGVQSTIVFENPRNGERIQLSYNPQINRLPTVNQIPDNVLSLEKAGNSVRFKFVFDAKYRINPAAAGSDYKTRYMTPGPEEDDINTMHRYRDAIVDQENNRQRYDRHLYGAYVLFPFANEDEYRNHHFYRSIESVNIGALPFLPSATNLVTELIAELIDESVDSMFERATLPVGFPEKLTDEDISQKDVLVGIVKDAQQLALLVKERAYYVQAKNVSEANLPIKYIALYQPRNQFSEGNAGIFYYGEVVTTTRTKLADIPFAPFEYGAEEYYYLFSAKNWQRLKKPIGIHGFGPSNILYTHHILLFNSEFTHELLLKTIDELRLYHELKRLSSPVGLIEDKDAVNGFEFNGNRIFVRANDVTIHTKGGNSLPIYRESYGHQPRMLYRKIRSILQEQ